MITGSDVAALKIVAPPNVNPEDYSVQGMRRFRSWLSRARAEAVIGAEGPDDWFRLRFTNALKGAFDAEMEAAASPEHLASLQKAQRIAQWANQANALGLAGRRPVLASAVHAWVERFGVPDVESIIKAARPGKPGQAAGPKVPGRGIWRR
jgi:hypothetical protein